MHCKNCLAPLSNGDTYCKVCGKPVEKSTAYPSNEEIIKSYNEQNQTSVFSGVKSVVEQPKPVQSLEQTNVMTPIKEDAMMKMPTTQQVSSVGGASAPSSIARPVAPTSSTVQVESQPVVQVPSQVVSPVEQPVVSPAAPVAPAAPVRPEPLPIVNEKEGISKKIFALGIIISVVATALIACLICIPIISNKVNATKKEVTDFEPVIKTVVEERVLFSGYSFIIPEGYSYKISGTQLIVEKIDTKEAMSVQVSTNTLANLKANLTALKTNLTTAKWTVGKMYTDTSIKNRAYLTVEAASNNKKVMIGYTKANAKQVFGIVYLNPNNVNYPTTTVDVFNDIIDSAKETAVVPTTNIATHTTKKVFFATTVKK